MSDLATNMGLAANSSVSEPNVSVPEQMEHDNVDR